MHAHDVAGDEPALRKPIRLHAFDKNPNPNPDPDTRVEHPADEGNGEDVGVAPARVREILEERARILAHVVNPEDSRGEAWEIVRFELNEEHYAIEARYVQKVLMMTDVVPLPGAPSHFLGFINYRGDLLAVVDLRPFLQIAGHAGTLTTLLVLGEDKPMFALAVAAVRHVSSIRSAELQPHPGAYFRGVTADALMVLHGGRFLQEPRLVIDQIGF